MLLPIQHLPVPGLPQPHRPKPRPPTTPHRSIDDLDRFDPARGPDWRLQRVVETLDNEALGRVHGARFARRELAADGYLALLWKFVRALRTRGVSPASRLAAQYPGPAAAWGVYCQPLLRLGVETRIL